jgi:hypothetical protein
MTRCARGSEWALDAGSCGHTRPGNVFRAAQAPTSPIPKFRGTPFPGGPRASAKADPDPDPEPVKVAARALKRVPAERMGGATAWMLRAPPPCTP